jgi:hypothetical protein
MVNGKIFIDANRDAMDTSEENRQLEHRQSLRYEV